MQFFPKKCIFWPENEIFSKQLFYSKLISDENLICTCQKYIFKIKLWVCDFHQILPIYSITINQFFRHSRNKCKSKSSYFHCKVENTMNFTGMWRVEAELHQLLAERRCLVAGRSTISYSHFMVQYLMNRNK